MKSCQVALPAIRTRACTSILETMQSLLSTCINLAAKNVQRQIRTMLHNHCEETHQGHVPHSRYCNHDTAFAS